MGTTHDRMKSDLGLANRSPHTIREYLRLARAFVAFHHRPAQKMGEAEVRTWLHHLKDNKRVSPHTLKMALATVRWLYERTFGRPEVVGSIPWPKILRPLTATLTHDEALAVIVAAPSPWVRMVIEIAYASGLRLSEVVRLRVEDLLSVFVVVTRSTRKRGSPQRRRRSAARWTCSRVSSPKAPTCPWRTLSIG